MNFNLSFINVHNQDSFLKESIYNLKAHTMYSFDPKNFATPYNSLYMSSQTESWMKERLGVSSLLTMYNEMGLIVPNWPNDDESANLILADNGKFFRGETFATSEQLMLNPPTQPKVFFFSIRRMPKLIEYNNIPPSLTVFSSAVRVRIRENYPLGMQMPSYADPYDVYFFNPCSSFIDMEGVFDLDLAAITTLFLFPKVEIVVDLDEKILYNTNYSGYFMDSIKKHLNKYE